MRLTTSKVKNKSSTFLDFQSCHTPFFVFLVVAKFWGRMLRQFPSYFWENVIMTLCLYVRIFLKIMQFRYLKMTAAHINQWRHEQKKNTRTHHNTSTAVLFGQMWDEVRGGDVIVHKISSYPTIFGSHTLYLGPLIITQECSKIKLQLPTYISLFLM